MSASDALAASWHSTIVRSGGRQANKTRWHWYSVFIGSRSSIHTLDYRTSYHLLKADQWGVNRETVRYIRKQEGLQVIKKAHQRCPVGASTTTPTRAAYPNHVWSYDFVHDETTEPTG